MFHICKRRTRQEEKKKTNTTNICLFVLVSLRFLYIYKIVCAFFFLHRIWESESQKQIIRAIWYVLAWKLTLTEQRFHVSSKFAINSHQIKWTITSKLPIFDTNISQLMVFLHFRSFCPQSSLSTIGWQRAFYICYDFLFTLSQKKKKNKNQNQRVSFSHIFFSSRVFLFMLLFFFLREIICFFYFPFIFLFTS